MDPAQHDQHVVLEDDTTTLYSIEQPMATSGASKLGPNNLPSPYHPTYRCRWIRCMSVLHNLDTLHRHVFKRHSPDPEKGSPAEEFICWWKGCRFLVLQDDNETVETSHIFEDEEKWREHIEEEHLSRVALLLGDGPSTSTGLLSSSQVQQRFLSDTSGHEITTLLPQQFPKNCEYPPHDVLELTQHDPDGHQRKSGRDNEDAQRGFLKAHEYKANDKRRIAEETLRAMISRKQKIGPGIERGGCTLINEARRATFMQNPGISRFIETEF